MPEGFLEEVALGHSHHPSHPSHLPLTGPFSSSDDRASVLFSLKGQIGTDTGRDLAYCWVGRAEAGGTENDVGPVGVSSLRLPSGKEWTSASVPIPTSQPPLAPNPGQPGTLTVRALRVRFAERRQVLERGVLVHHKEPCAWCQRPRPVSALPPACALASTHRPPAPCTGQALGLSGLPEALPLPPTPFPWLSAWSSAETNLVSVTPPGKATGWAGNL